MRPNSFFCILLDFLKVLYFIPGCLCHETPSLARWVTLCIEARFAQLLRTYERSTCSKSSILFTDTKSGPMKNRTTPICATCTSPKMHLICPPKFCISIIFNLSWDGCKILPFWTPDLGSKFRRYQSLYEVSLSFCFNDEGKQAVKTKAECFKAWRLFLLSSLFLSNMHYSPSVRSIWLDI